MSVQVVLRIFSLDMIKVPGMACLLAPNEESPFWFYVVGFCASDLALLLMLATRLKRLRYAGNTKAADGAEFVLTIIFAVQPPFFLNLASETMQGAMAEGLMWWCLWSSSHALAQRLTALALMAALSVSELVLVALFLRNIRAFRRGVTGGGWRLGASPVAPRSLTSAPATLRSASPHTRHGGSSPSGCGR